ncbi:Hypothetical protein LUCI_1604 [Lucifera butyrica]|uniref:Uncharacterized protein n=1 Tax=Lucifera butyrica TaxID=1351585 RepID=A0A498R864_9FIRM|nr:hypothetical protein [Lucifera butyrica]VBB06373.1 Hypothetical protein LUCI_1604 [Lucifera butyrica]
MAYIIACLMASLSFLINKVLLRYLGMSVIISLSPAVEEGAKTLLAYYLGADVLATHILFGLLEAGYDWIQNRHGGLPAALLSIGGHTLFGLLTVEAAVLTGSIWLGMAVALIAHLAWNVTVIRISSS